MADIGYVAVLDDDPWRRRGFASAIVELGGLFTTAGSWDPADPEAAEGAAGAGTLLLAGPATGDRWDRWAVLSTARRIRDTWPDQHRRVMLVAADTHPLATLRALEVGVHAVMDITELHSLTDLEAALLTPPSDRHPALCTDRRALHRLGLTLSSTPQAFLDRTVSEGVRTGGPGRQHSRRQAISLRARLSASLGVASIGMRAESGDSGFGSWRQLNAISALARGHCEPP